MSTHAEPGPQGEPTPDATTDLSKPDHTAPNHTALDHQDEPPDTTPPAAPVKSRRTSINSRVGNAWIALVAGAIILVILLIFILQNLARVEVSLFFWDFSLPLGVTVLLSVIAGALVMALVGGVRILQLRRVARK
ncbi:LapA family protein [Nocardia callitridis]|uniref:Lipopolysaccharide assembly protein A domain-containing protein n=1 Tax=Nocardia callitridis TaxID=648753 RepID=A0ABP9KGI6_9NOCA